MQERNNPVKTFTLTPEVVRAVEAEAKDRGVKVSPLVDSLLRLAPEIRKRIGGAKVRRTH